MNIVDSADPFRPSVREENTCATRRCDFIMLIITLGVMAVYAVVSFVASKKTYDEMPPTQTSTVETSMETPLNFMVWTCCSIYKFNVLTTTQSPSGETYDVLSNLLNATEPTAFVECNDDVYEQGKWHREFFFQLKALPNAAITYNGLNDAIIRVEHGDSDTPGSLDCSMCLQDFKRIRLYSLDTDEVNKLTCLDTYDDSPKHHAFSQAMLAENFMQVVQLGLLSYNALNGTVTQTADDGVGSYIRSDWGSHATGVKNPEIGFEINAPKQITVIKETKPPYSIGQVFGSISGGCNTLFVVISMVYAVFRPYLVCHGTANNPSRGGSTQHPDHYSKLAP